MAASKKSAIDVSAPGVAPPHRSDGEAAIADLRFRSLLGVDAWAELPQSVRSRFSKRIGPGMAVTYRGEVVATELSRSGRMLAFLSRAIGAPLPLTNGAVGKAAVVVRENENGGQIWQRTYERRGRLPQVVCSTKRFRGPTGLEEYVGFGIGMALRVTVVGGQLVFRSEHYFLELGRRRIQLPRLLSPGVMEIVHRDESDRPGQPFAFSFRLTLLHPWFGRLVYQLAYFAEA